MLTYSESSIIPQSVFDYKWDSCLEAFEAQLQVIELDRCGSVCTSTQLLRSNIVLFRQLLLSRKCDQRDTECHTIGQIKNAIRPVSNFASKFREAHIMLWFLLESNLKNYDSCMRQVKACHASGRIVIPQPLKFLRAASQHHQNQQSTCSNKLLLNLNASQGTCEELTQPGTSVSNSHLHGRLASEIMSIISDEHILTGDLSLYSSVHLCQQVQGLLKQIEQSAIDAWQPRSFKASKSIGAASPRCRHWATRRHALRPAPGSSAGPFCRLR